MKLLDIVQDANKNLARNKGRTILTVIAIFIGAMTLTITNGIGLGVSNYIDQQLGNVGAEDVLIVQAKTDDFGGGPQKYEEDKGSGGASQLGPFISMLGTDDLEDIRSVTGVKSADLFINVSPDFIKGANNEKYQLSAEPYITGTNLAMAAGNSPDNDSPEPQIVLAPDYPTILGYSSAEAAVGQAVTIGITSALGKQSEVEAKVVGVQEEALTSMGGAPLNETLAKTLHGIQTEGQPAATKDNSPFIVARVNSEATDDDVSAVKKRLDEKGYAAMTVKDQIGIFKQAIDAIIAVLNGFAAIALLAASFGIVNTLLMAVQERTKEIGLMKAMGMGSRKIFLLFSLEAILLGFWGSLLGSLAGIGIGLVANRVAASTFLKDLPGFQLTAFSMISVLIIMLIIMTIALIAGTLPARRASRKDPIEALRYE
jgi:putative ABC transport system permease protein